MRALLGVRVKLPFSCNVLVFLILVSSSAANGQRHDNWPKPPEPAVHSHDLKGSGAQVERLNAFELDHEARELDELARTIPGDIEQVKKGLLPKDTIEKLKRIEKLARKLRNEVGR
jgi:hypothetical protein